MARRHGVSRGLVWVRDQFVGWVIVRLLEVPRRLVGGLLLTCGLAMLWTAMGVTTGVTSDAGRQSVSTFSTSVRKRWLIFSFSAYVPSPSFGRGGSRSNVIQPP